MKIEELIKEQNLVEILDLDDDVEENLLELAKSLNLEMKVFDRIYFFALKVLAYGFILGKRNVKGGNIDKDKEWYRNQIISLINEIQNEGMLEYFHTFIKLVIEKWG